MDVVIPFAAVLVGEEVPPLDALALPRLQQLLEHLDPVAAPGTDPLSLSPPHERLLARLAGWPDRDGALPWAADQARRDGLDVSQGAWGLLSPMHWRVGSEHLSVGDPEDLDLDEAASRALFEAIAPLFVEDGWQMHWGAPSRWYLVHPMLEHLPTASLDRVIGRNPDPWLPEGDGSRPLRRLWSEVQMVLHAHPVNDARAEAGRDPVNSVWLSGCGPAQPALPSSVQIETDLVGPARRGHGDDWIAAWQALDARVLGPMLERLKQGETWGLHLCGERGAVSLRRPLSRCWRDWWPRRRRADFRSVLRGL